MILPAGWSVACSSVPRAPLGGGELAFLRTRPRTEAVSSVLSRIRGFVRRNGAREAEAVLFQTCFSK